MEFRQHLELVWKERRFVVLFVLVTLLVALLVLAVRPVQYRSSVAFSIKMQNRQQTQDYQYDDYYALKAAELHGDTLMSWFLIPAVVQEMYSRSDVTPESPLLQGFGSFFKTKKYSAQNVVVTFHHSSQEVAKRLSQAVVDVVREKSKELNDSTGNDQATFSISAEQPVVAAVSKPYFLAAIVSLIVGLSLGIFGVYTRRYFQKEG